MSIPLQEEPPPQGKPSPRNPFDQLPTLPGRPTSEEKVPFSKKGALPKKLVNHQRDAVAGLDKCPRCGSSEAEYVIEKRALVCGSCRHENHGKSVGERFGRREKLRELEGYTASVSSAAKISSDVIVTVKCDGCGAEVAVNTAVKLSEKCHWCRQTLSLNNRVPNGAVPDGILPFTITKAEAMSHIRGFLSGRWFFALTRFKREFQVENVYPIYLPYTVVDARFEGELWGSAELHKRSYKQGKSTRYDYDVFSIYRHFSALANDVPVEASSARQVDIHQNTNNVLQAVQPFPVEHALDFRAHYLNGFHSERRDLNPATIHMQIHNQLLTILRGQGALTIGDYEKRGVRWNTELVDVEGIHMASIYLPIWLYSFVETNAKVKGRTRRQDLIHYIAVNGITGKTMGSIPVNRPKLLLFSVIIGIVVGVPASFIALILLGVYPWWLL